MNSSLRTLATFVVAATLAFAGCEKEDNITPNIPDTPEEETPENIYVGTSWSAHLENNYTLQEQGYNIEMELTYDIYLDFLDSTHAELFHDLYVYVPAFPSASQSDNMTEELTYSFSHDSVFFNATYVDEESGETLEYGYVAIYDSVAKTLTMDYDDPDMEEMMGTSIIVFNLVEDSSKTIVPRPQANTGKNGWQKVVNKIAQAIGF
ncbi:MAG: hypothetical protein IJM33_07655 [Bacteroidales bacterium]|nr:hypothetical protein [Bacteroidales bacterium]MBR3413323.1 hypothetical protein [Bacteroidales bacterium]